MLIEYFLVAPTHPCPSAASVSVLACSYVNRLTAYLSRAKPKSKLKLKQKPLLCVCSIKFYSLCQRSNLRCFCQSCHRVGPTLEQPCQMPAQATVNRQRGQQQLHLSSSLRTLEIFILFAYCATWRQLFCITRVRRVMGRQTCHAPF